MIRRRTPVRARTTTGQAGWRPVIGGMRCRAGPAPFERGRVGWSPTAHSGEVRPVRVFSCPRHGELQGSPVPDAECPETGCASGPEDGGCVAGDRAPSGTAAGSAAAPGRTGRRAWRTSRRRPARWFLPCPKLCSSLYASRASNVWNVSFPMAHLRRVAHNKGVAHSNQT